jgi:hypothetical protein
MTIEEYAAQITARWQPLTDKQRLLIATAFSPLMD